MKASSDISADASAQDSVQGWKGALREMGEAHGFFEEIGTEHSALFVRKGKTLIVTFENLDHVYGHDDRMPWGFDFVQAQGWSILGLMAHDWTWYRADEVIAFFDRLKREKFFDGFERVVFYGASMGGYAACAFSAACPGATVVAISPQATLDREITSWETRYIKGWRRDYSGKYGYAPDQIGKAERLFLLFDPLEPLDAMHAALYRGKNITKLKCRFQGHRIASGLIAMKLLKPVVAGCVDGSLTAPGFYKMLRTRHGYRRYLRDLLNRIDIDRHPALVIRLAEHVLATGAAPVFRKKLREARTILDKQSGAVRSGKGKSS